MVIEGGKRILSKSIQKKELVTPEILEQNMAKYENNNCERELLFIRVCDMFWIGFADFFDTS